MFPKIKISLGAVVGIAIALIGSIASIIFVVWVCSTITYIPTTHYAPATLTADGAIEIIVLMAFIACIYCCVISRDMYKLHKIQVAKLDAIMKKLIDDKR